MIELPNVDDLILFLGEKGIAYTLVTHSDYNFASDLVRNLVRFWKLSLDCVLSTDLCLSC